jgi:hypothetical protein
VDIVVSGGSDPDRQLPAPRSSTSQNRLLELIAVGVFLVAAGTAYTGWEVHRQTEDSRVLNCAYLTVGNGDEPTHYDDLAKYEKKLVDQLDCDVPGR